MDGITMTDYDLVLQHRELVYEAEVSRLNGERAITPKEMHKRLEVLFSEYEVFDKL